MQLLNKNEFQLTGEQVIITTNIMHTHYGAQKSLCHYCHLHHLCFAIEVQNNSAVL